MLRCKRRRSNILIKDLIDNREEYNKGLCLSGESDFADISLKVLTDEEVIILEAIHYVGGDVDDYYSHEDYEAFMSSIDKIDTPLYIEQVNLLKIVAKSSDREGMAQYLEMHQRILKYLEGE